MQTFKNFIISENAGVTTLFKILVMWRLDNYIRVAPLKAKTGKQIKSLFAPDNSKVWFGLVDTTQQTTYEGAVNGGLMGME